MVTSSRQELLVFLEERIYKPALRNPKSDRQIKRKVHCTRLRLRRLKSAKAIRQYFWSALSNEQGMDSYQYLHSTDKARFEEIQEEFATLYGRN